MKESPRRYTNPFLSDEENEKLNFWNNHDLEYSNIKDGLTNNCEDEEFRKSLEQSNIPSEFFKKETELFTDKNVLGCELPEFLVCYKESAFHVKDICVDEGIPNGERILFDEDNHELCIFSPGNEGKHGDKIENSFHPQFLNPELLRFPPVEDYYVESNLCSGILNDADPIDTHRIISNNNSDTAIRVQDLQNSIPDKNLEDAATKECGTNEEVDSVVPNVTKDDNDDEDGPSEWENNELKFSQDLDTVPKATDNHGEEQISSGANLLDNASTAQVVGNNASSLQQDRPLPSLKSLLKSTNGAYDFDEQPPQGFAEEMSRSPVVGYETEKLGRSVQTTVTSKEYTMDGSNTLNLSNGFHGVQNPENVHNLPIEMQGAPNHHDVASNNITMLNPVQRGEGESSFSVAGHVSGLITYSGPIAVSGSASLRSDSSTTSTRSFAFPILQTEWNSSPVRMAKADRRRLQKHRGWRHSILCCRF